MARKRPPETYDEHIQQVERDDLADAIRETRKLPRGTPLIERLRDIVTTESAARIDGLLVDLWTASTVVQVHDALNEDNRRKFAAMPLRRMVDIAYKLARGGSKP